MKFREAGTIIFIGVIAIAAAYAIFIKIKPGVLPEDSFVEEFIEEILEDQTGFDIDLSSDSPEETK